MKRFAVLALYLAGGCNQVLGHAPGHLADGGDATPICSMDPTSDPLNCGACGHDCGGGGCAEGRCQPLLLTSENPRLGGVYFMVLAGGAAYATSWCTSSSVVTIPFDRSAPTTLVPGSGSICGCGLAYDQGEIYFGRVNYSTSRSTIESVSPAGGIPTVITSNLDGRPTIAVDAQDIYYSLTWTGTPGIYRVHKDGTLTTLLYYGDTRGLAVDDTSVYAGAVNTGDVVRIPKDRSTVTTVGHTPQPTTFAIDGASVYWTDKLDRRIYSVPRAGGDQRAVTPSFAYQVDAIALDATTVYFTSLDGNVVVAIDKDGRNLRTVATDQLGGAGAIAVDDRFVYWSAGVGTGTGAVWRVAK